MERSILPTFTVLFSCPIIKKKKNYRNTRINPINPRGGSFFATMQPGAQPSSGRIGGSPNGRARRIHDPVVYVRCALCKRRERGGMPGNVTGACWRAGARERGNDPEEVERGASCRGRRVIRDTRGDRGRKKKKTMVHGGWLMPPPSRRRGSEIEREGHCTEVKQLNPADPRVKCLNCRVTDRKTGRRLSERGIKGRRVIK